MKGVVFNMVERISGLGGVSPIMKHKALQRAYGAENVAANSDEANISPFAKELGRIMGELDGVSDVRQDKINDFKKHIAAGTYNPDPAKVAQSLVIAGLLNGEE